MLQDSRLNEILKLVDQKGAVRVDELAKLFNISESTIRRDLIELSKQNKLIKVHGGATATNYAGNITFDRVDKDYFFRENLEKEIKMNKMGTVAVPKIMLSMGIPMVLSMVLQACYNIVDSMFVARIPDSEGLIHAGEYAVNALTLAFPIQMLIVAFGIGTGIGINALLSKTLGENNPKKVARVAGNGVSLGIIIYVFFFIFGILGINIYLRSQTSNAIILSMGRTYLMICTLLSIGMIMFSIWMVWLSANGHCWCCLCNSNWTRSINVNGNVLPL